MKKLFLLGVLLLLVHVVYAQVPPTPPPPPPPPPPEPEVPYDYAKTHCFILNSSSKTSFFSTSYDKQQWEEMKIDAGANLDLAVTDSIYLRIFSTKTVYSIKTAYPSKYYKIVYDKTLKKWVFRE